MTAEPSGPALARRLTTADAVVIGVGSMVGAGLFSAFAPAARAAGALLLLSLGVAAIVAFCNAASSAQLAAQYPTSGGTYVYGRERLGPWWGFVAGWGFVIGKTASCAAMALVLAAYLVPEPWQKAVAVAAVVTLAAVNYRGITRTARLTRLIVALVLVLLAVVLVAVAAARPAAHPAAGMGAVGPGGVLQGAAILFFAFAGYARIATLGEEVVDPARTIPRAILGAFAVVVPLYAVTGVLLLRTLGVDALASSPAPLRDAAATVTSGGWLQLVVVVAAAAATLGALLALIAGVGRTALAMAREGDLPRPLAAVHPRYAVPHVAEVTVAVVVCALVLLTDLRSAIGFSSFGVLTYYAVANAAALTQQRPYRRYPRVVPVVGLLGCMVLAFAVPTTSLVAGVVVLAVGLLGRLVVRGRRQHRAAA
ncbi:amino acid/polyamine/organocation transporter (APC superfamily) [Humibacillus xanthopallidus]|uniref:Amino acid/polyamine/organocation transporter (APC superfamily) n=1 Tax=Humibacillus xanthopallidus TaxID=412689 RepID=A0A543PUZ6_9MICO|nr:APC family permease [Humibacillus xanthopallidus]TQN47902.1 amino acid/polyamine/organocation transporter (APC superfamily) [Humibacillus xanthopallidus]